MLKKIFIFLALLFLSKIKAQINSLDPMLVNVNQSSVTSGIIYERVNPIADLYNFNQRDNAHNVANYTFFEQALNELYCASQKTKLISYNELRNRIAADLNTKNVVNIGIINTPFQILNYNAENPTLGGLNLGYNNQLIQIEGKVPFFDMYAFVIAPLKKVAEGSVITYKFRSDLILNNGIKTIKTLVADFGDGVLRNIIIDGVIVSPTVTFNNIGENVEKKLIFNVTFNDNMSLTTFGKIYLFKPINNQTILSKNSSTSCEEEYLIEDMYPSSNRLISDYSFQGYGENESVFGEIEARVFYHTNNGNKLKTLLNPIVIVDGFDPGDKRKIQDCDCENAADCASSYIVNGVFNSSNHQSIQDLMEYGDVENRTQNLITILRSNGYDVVIVNQPTYYRNGVKIDGGADFIERNAMNLATLIKRLNLKLTQNGSSSKLIVVGPSMGGQISRYALAWMEKNNIPHNTKLWVSFDSPNLGANVPLGDQALINLLKSDSPTANQQYNELLGSVASKEQLIEFHQQGTSQDVVNEGYLNGSTISQGMPTNSGNPYYQAHYNNQFNNGLPNSKGFPINLRKVAILNVSPRPTTSCIISNYN